LGGEWKAGASRILGKSIFEGNMARLIGKLLGTLVQLALLPFALVLAVPMGIMKAKRAQAARLLFTGDEQALLGKAQRAINADRTGLLSPDRDLLRVGECIEESRVDYQLIKGRERFDSTFSEFVAPRINKCRVSDWGTVISFFDLVNHGFVEPDNLKSPSALHEKPNIDVDHGIPF
jgi:hypothetical protein